jgi:hypothetical protein
VIAGDGSFDLLELEKLALVEGDVLILQLDPHLELLAAEFALVEPMSQLPLFPVLAVA